MGAILIEIPIFLARNIGVMRVGEAGGQTPWARIKPAAIFTDFAHRMKPDLVIIFHLVRGLGHTSARDRAHIVIPPIDPLTWFAVIGGPAEIGGIDIGRAAFLKTMHLVRTHEMHLARQAGLIARAAQMMRIGRDIRRELGRVVIDTRDRGQLPRHEPAPPRRAKRRGRVAIGKPRRAGGQFLEIGRMQPVRRTIRKKCSIQLVHHDDQDIGAGHRMRSFLRNKIGLGLHVSLRGNWRCSPCDEMRSIYTPNPRHKPPI